MKSFNERAAGARTIVAPAARWYWRTAARSTRTLGGSMQRFSFQALVYGSVAIGAVAVHYIPAERVLLAVLLPLVVCMFCGWILVFETRGMRRSRGWKEWFWWGFIITEPSNWTKPVVMSSAAVVLFICAALVVGATLRLLWIVYA